MVYSVHRRFFHVALTASDYFGLLFNTILPYPVFHLGASSWLCFHSHDRIFFVVDHIHLLYGSYNRISSNGTPLCKKEDPKSTAFTKKTVPMVPPVPLMWYRENRYLIRISRQSTTVPYFFEKFL